MDQFGLPERRIVSSDGTGIAYWISRPSPDMDLGVTIVLANGIGVTRVIWQDLVTALRDRYTLLFWDYRGTYQSEPPPDASSLTILDNAHDLVAILDAEQLQRVVLIGWSMGVQVSLEAWLVAADRIVGMVLLNGTGGKTLDTALGVPGLMYWVPTLTRYLTDRHGERLNRYMSLVWRRELVRFVKAVGLAGPTVDTDMLGKVIEGYAAHDFRMYLTQLNNLGFHAPEHLDDIRAPVLIVVGGRDSMTPPIAGKRLRALLPNAELERIDEATHFMPIEFQERLRARIEKFITQRVLKPQAPEVAASSPATSGGSSPEQERKERRHRSHERRSMHQLLRKLLHRPQG